MTSASVVALVFVVLAGQLAGVWHAARNRGESVNQARGAVVRSGLVMALLLAVVMLASGYGILARFDATPPYMMRFLLACVIGTVLMGSLSRYGARLAYGLPVAAIVGFQAFRIMVEFPLHEFYREGLAPVQITYLGRNFDIITGITAIPVAWLAARGKASRPLLLAWNCLGLGLLANVVTVAVLSMPGPLRLFMNEPSTRLVAELPYVFVPAVFVTTALFGHVLLFRRLFGSRRSERPERAPLSRTATP